MSTSDRLLAEYVAARPKSAAAHQRARDLFAADGATHFTRAATPFRPYIDRAAGSRKWDIDGHEYLDFLGVAHGLVVALHDEHRADAHRASQHETEQNQHDSIGLVRRDR